MAEIVTLGEALVRLTPPRFHRLETATSLEVEVGGAELNTAAGLVRLGHSTAWVSRVPDSPLGALVRSRVRAAGVDDRFVQTGAGRAGLYFLEEAAAPRAASILYDRAGSSTALAAPGDFDWPRIFDGANWFHVSGITAALSANAAAVVAEAMAAADTAGLTVSVDLNFRAKLWSAAEAGRVMSGLLSHCDVLFASESDAASLFDITGETYAAVAAKLCERFGLQAVATMRRDAVVLWHDRVRAIGYRAGQRYESKAYEVEVVDRLGTGDAFAAGVIDGLLHDDFEQGLETGAAMGALAHTIRGDLPLISKAEITAALAGDSLRIRR